jgi:hypothetical protein
MKSVFSVAVPALLLMSASAFAADPTDATMQPSGGKSDQQLSAGNGGSIGNGPSNTAMAANSSDTMNPSVSATSELSGSADTSPTYQGGRRAYRGKSEASLNASEAEETAQLPTRSSCWRC